MVDYVPTSNKILDQGASPTNVVSTSLSTTAALNTIIPQVVSGSSVDIEGLSVAGNVISTTDSSAGIEITGNLIPSSDGVYQLGSASRRWQTLYVSSATIDVGGATISSDGSGAITIAATAGDVHE